MYRATPHSTTQKSPSELMFGRTIRDKVPGINQHFEVDEELRDCDKERKEKGRVYTDERRRAKASDLKEGDKVWLKKMLKTNKLAPRFDPQAHTVIEKKGAEVIVEDDNTGVRYRRNVAHAIKAPEPSPEEDDTTDKEEQTTVSPRPKRKRTMPEKLLD